MPVMQTSDLTPRQYWDEVRANPNRAKFGFGNKAAIINIDLQRAYTDMAAGHPTQHGSGQEGFPRHLFAAAHRG